MPGMHTQSSRSCRHTRDPVANRLDLCCESTPEWSDGWDEGRDEGRDEGQDEGWDEA